MMPSHVRVMARCSMCGILRYVSLVCAFAAVAFIPSSASAQTEITFTAGTFVVRGTSVSVDEGAFRVPAVRGGTTGDSLTLRLVRFRSTATRPGAPIVFLAGGPGDAATRAFGGMPMEFLNELRAIADVIALDQRGTGRSEPLRPLCAPGASLPLDQPANPTQMLALLRARVAECFARADAATFHVNGLTTAESADDLEALRKALGVPHVSVLAGSYGTHLALATTMRHPTLIDRMVLAGVEGPDHTVKDPARVDHVLSVIAAERRTSLVQDIRTLVERLVREPARVDAPDGRTIVVGEWDLRRWVAESLDAVPEIEAMLAAIPRMLDGEFRVLAQWAAVYRAPRPLNVMNLAMDCASYASRERLTHIAVAAPHATLGDVMSFPLATICDTPGLPRLPDGFRAAVSSRVSALLIAGTWDGRTPPRNAEEVARGMPNAELMVIPGASHSLMGHPDAMKRMLTFFKAGAH